MSELTLNERLDIIAQSIEYDKLLTLRYASDLQHDQALIDWFIDGGEIRSYTCNVNRQYGATYTYCLYKKGVMLRSIVLNANASTAEYINNQVNETWLYDVKLLIKFRNTNKSFNHCTNNLYRTVKEICGDFKMIDEWTFKYNDGSYGQNNVLHLSKDSPNNFHKRAMEAESFVDELVKIFN